jgi:hypothetical protein
MNDQPKQAEKSARLKQIEERRAKMASFVPEREARVRVNPANDQIRKAIKHPSGNIAFPESGSVEWPNDSFTKRRIREGAVTREDDKAKEAKGAKTPPTPPPPKPAA